MELRVADTIKTRQLIVPQDRVAVALSGGKDSTALLLLLHRLLPAWEDVRLIAITIDEGIAGYREETIQSAERLTGRLGIEHHCISFTSLFGESLDAFLTGRETQACSICGIMRKKALVVGAQKAGATKLATGHNLDDEAQSVLMNVFRGDLPRLVRNSRGESSREVYPEDQTTFTDFRKRDCYVSFAQSCVERTSGVPVHPVCNAAGGPVNAVRF